MHHRWEYWVHKSNEPILSQEEMSEFGDQAWELVAVVHTGRDADHYEFYLYYFKRPESQNK